jgi:hypothetical protein
MGLLAVLLATVGLVLGTTVIAVKLMPATPAPAPIPLSARIQADSEFMAQVTAWDLKQRKTFLPASEAARGIEA